MRRSRVLIIDDSLTIRAMIEALLKNQANCHAVEVAADIPTARTMIRDFRPSVITLDLNMPEMNGFAFLDELRGYPHAPIVVVSSSTKEGSESSVEALRRGADACFDKSQVITRSREFIRVLEKASIERLRRLKT